ncbi:MULTISPECIES: terminase small subunit [Clostridia]|uniref:terminase small subunit n=1 Tax=Clostridia TaxID=186801 RepID=UPI00067F36E2|nr:MULTISPECIES: terminase small subunit [Clostridia]
MALTEKQKIFADEYLIDLNATRAYRVAYPAVKNDDTAAAAGSRLLKNVKVAVYIDQELENLRSERVADAQEVMEHLTAVMRGEVKEEVVVVEGAGEGYSEAKIIEKQIAERDRIKAAELLGKRYSMFTDKVDVNGVEGVVIVDDIPKPDNTS